MSVNNTAKKRKVDIDESGISLAAVLAEMQEMKSKLSRMDELESRCINMQKEMDGLKSRSTIMQNEINSMKDRISHIDELENKSNLLQRSVQILSKESTWEYSAPSIPDSHWIESGFVDEDYIELMRRLEDQMKRRAIRIRNGECFQYINLGEESPEGEAGILLQHDDALLPHWKEFATALQLLHGNNIQFTIQNVQLSHSVINMLIPALKGRLKLLFLDNNGFINIRKGIDFSIKCMESNHQLKEFYMANNQLRGMENARSLLDAIISHPSIESVRLEGCLGGDINGYDVLCYLIDSGKNFHSIDLENNNIRTGGGTAISDYITRNAPLCYLLLSNNDLNDDDALLIAEALKYNTNLQSLLLGGNNITSLGIEALYKVIYDPTNLNTLAGCNHTCNIEGCRIEGSDFFNDANLDNTSDKPRFNRGKKICRLLINRHKEGSNVQHLNAEFEDEDGGGSSLTLKIIPTVLETVHRYCTVGLLFTKTIAPLSITYEILRGWKMPELYDTKRPI